MRAAFRVCDIKPVICGAHGTDKVMNSLGRMMAKHENFSEIASQPRAHPISEVRSMLAVTTHLYDIRVRTKTKLFICLSLFMSAVCRFISVRSERLLIDIKSYKTTWNACALLTIINWQSVCSWQQWSTIAYVGHQYLTRKCSPLDTTAGIKGIENTPF